MIKSKVKIEKQLKKKTAPKLMKTIILAKKNPKWREVASILTGPRKKRKNVNLKDLENFSSDSIVVCGKVLSEGEISKKKKIVALGFSEKARKKLLEAGCELKEITEEINLNKNAKGIQILK